MSYLHNYLNYCETELQRSCQPNLACKEQRDSEHYEATALSPEIDINCTFQRYGMKTIQNDNNNKDNN